MIKDKESKAHKQKSVQSGVVNIELRTNKEENSEDTGNVESDLGEFDK